MSDAPHTSSEKRRALPLEVYASLVNSLYEDLPSFAFGVVTAVVAALLTAWHAQSVTILSVAIAMAAVGVGRIIHMASYARHKPALDHFKSVRHWERAYEYGSTAHVGLIGAWCFLAFIVTDDRTVQLFALAVALAYAVGISGRNFGGERLVNAQLVALSFPMITGLLATGSVDNALLAVFLAPFFISLKRISARLRAILLDAVISARDLRIVNSRFDTALNNMPHGLAMFDSSGRSMVANSRWGSFFAVPEAARHGVFVHEIFGAAAAAGLFRSEARQTASDLAARVTGGKTGKMEVEVGGRILDMTFQPMPNGGSIVVAEDVTQARADQARISHMARHDALTGLPNRVQFQERLMVAIEAADEAHRPAVLFVDLDHFKPVNDAFGHAFGDALLVDTAERLKLTVGERDVIARFGADEFVVLMSACERPDQAARLAQRVIGVLAEPYHIDGRQAVLGASVGVAIGPDDGDTAEALLKNADLALDRAKREGRGAFRFYETGMDERAQARSALEIDLREAVRRGSLELHYQPLMNLCSLDITTCEALIRWPHAKRGMVSPAEFIPIAEETGLILEIGREVLRRACKACANWPAGTRVAVNISAIQLQRGDVVADVRAALKESGLAANRLEIEITESAFLGDKAMALGVLKRLKDLGARIALDDFGTGYSSLGYLHAFPLDKVKIDRSFLSGMGEGSRSLLLLDGVARLSRSLGLAVVVEGIETHEQLRLVEAGGQVDEIQGFLISRAVPAGELEAYFGRKGEALFTRAA